MSLGSLVRYDSRYDDAEDEIRDEDHNLVINPPPPIQSPVRFSEPDPAVMQQRVAKPSPPQTADSAAKPKSLVSYGDGYTDDDETSSENEDVKDSRQTHSSKSKPAVVNLGLFDGTSVLSSADSEATSLNDSFVDSPRGSNEAVRLPPEPQGRCSKSLQEKIAKMIEKKKSGRMNVNDYVQRKKEFRNPSIYEKLVTFIGIDEHGTNFPRRLYDPTIWGPESYYDALQKAQKEYHKEKEKEKIKRTQVDFVTGTKKPATSQAPATMTVSEKKSKWDQKIPPPPKSTTAKVPPAVQAAIKSNSKN